MGSYPFVSVILTGNCSLTQIDLCMKAFHQVNYPRDQLEYYLIIPFYRPISAQVKSFPGLRLIRFDQTLRWLPFRAQLEGLFFARGEYVQMLDARFQIHPDWLKTGISLLEMDFHDALLNTNRLLWEQSIDDPPPSLEPGLYRLQTLRQSLDSRFLPPELLNQLRVKRVSRPMVLGGQTSQHGLKYSHQILGKRVRILLSKYVLARN